MGIQKSSDINEYVLKAAFLYCYQQIYLLNFIRRPVIPSTKYGGLLA